TRFSRDWSSDVCSSDLGPVAHIVVSLGVLVAMGVNPLSFDSIRDAGDAAAALWWAGPMIGVMNLIPVLPLDGGHLALTGLERFQIGRASVGKGSARHSE